MLKQPKCLSPDKRTKKMWNIHTMGLYSVLKKESKSAICDNMDEPWGHYAKWNKPVTEGQIMHISNHQFSSVAQSGPTLYHHESQHARPPCPSPTPGVHPNSCPLSQWCHLTISSSVTPLLLLPSIFPSIRVFSNEPVLHIRWPKYWSFSFSISPSNKYSRLISFRIDWLHLLAVQGTLKSLLQHQRSKASILQQSAFFMAQLSHPYMTTGKSIALTRQTFVSKVMSLAF